MASNKYQNSKIYKLVNTVSNKIYYGSTYNNLKKRLRDHRSAYIAYKKKNRRYTTSCILFNEDFSGVKIVLVEEFSCNNKIELLKKEKYYIQNFPCVNKYIPTRTTKEYYKDNKDMIKKMNKIYREKNKEKIRKKKIKYYNDNILKIKFKKSEKILCQCGLYSTRSHLSRHKRTNRHLKRINN